MEVFVISSSDVDSGKSKEIVIDNINDSKVRSIEDIRKIIAIEKIGDSFFEGDLRKDGSIVSGSATSDKKAKNDSKELGLFERYSSKNTQNAKSQSSAKNYGFQGKWSRFPKSRSFTFESKLASRARRESESRNGLHGDKASEFEERRRKADWLVSAAAILSVFAWVAAFIVWIVLYVASPPDDYIFNSLLEEGAIGRSWDEGLLILAFTLLILSLIACFVAFLFNKLRMRRKTDKYRVSVFIIGGITIIGIVLFLINFGGNFLW